MTSKATSSAKKAAKSLYDDMPGTFSLCIQADCPMAAHCLRRIMWNKVPATQGHITIVNPAQTLPYEQCPHHRPDTPVIYAKGFTGMQQQMFPVQYDRFSTRLIGHFGRNAYFERRRGERLCTPKEIIYIRQLLQSLGLPDMEFDAYVERFNWND